ncbi:hypothetical protein CJ483_23785 [Bacillus sp. PK3_68]|nr:hypothetical protein CJ483_23785 [Bacillus sp. PK3_68]
MFLVLAILLSACTSNKESTSEGVEDFDSPVYSGGNLKIGIVGAPPKVREDNVKFISLSLGDVEEKNFRDVDAVFINKNYLPEAAEAKYAKVYLESLVPFIFINSEKVYLAFIDEELSYEDAHTSKAGDYLIGYFNHKYFGLSLYNHQNTKKTIQDCYSRVFSIIENAKNTGEINL